MVEYQTEKQRRARRVMEEENQRGGRLGCVHGHGREFNLVLRLGELMEGNEHMYREVGRGVVEFNLGSDSAQPIREFEIKIYFNN